MDEHSPLTELRLSDHVETITFSVDLNPETKQPPDSIVRDRLNEYLDSREEEHD